MFKFLLEKEFKQIKRNKFLPRIIIAYPIVALLVFPWATNMEIKNIDLSVVDLDHTSYSTRLIEKCVSSGYFHLVNTPQNRKDALNSINQHKSDIILEIPVNFERNIKRQTPTTVSISANSVDATKGGIGSSYLAVIVTNFGAELSEESVQLKAPPIQILSSYKFNPHSSYTFFMVPALMVMLLTMISGFLPALNIVAEKEAGSIEQINVTPVHRLTFILAKLIPYWIIGIIVLSIGLIIARLAYGLIPAGSLPTIYLFALVYIFTISGLGLTISGNSDTMQQAMFVMYFVMLLLILLSGLLTPIASMPDWAQMITRINPLRYFIEMMRGIYLKGALLSDLLPQLGALIIFALIFNTVAVLSYRKTE